MPASARRLTGTLLESDNLLTGAGWPGDGRRFGAGGALRSRRSRPDWLRDGRRDEIVIPSGLRPLLLRPADWVDDKSWRVTAAARRAARVQRQAETWTGSRAQTPSRP